MKFKFFIVLIYIISNYTFELYSQNVDASQRDSLLNVLNLNKKEDFKRVDILIKLVKTFRSDNQLEGIKYALMGSELAKKINYKTGLINIYGEIGVLYKQIQDFNKSEEYLKRALDISIELSDKLCLAKIYNYLGQLYFRQYNYTKALHNYFLSLNFYSDLNDNINKAGLLGNIGIVYWGLTDYPSALNYFQKALEISKTTGDKSNIVFCLGNISAVYSILKQHEKALKIYLEALKLDEELGDKESQASDLVNMAVILVDIKEFDKALLYNNKSFKINTEIKSRIGMMYNYNCFGDLYNGLANDTLNTKYSIRYKEENSQKALENYLKAISFGQEFNAVKELIEMYRIISEIYKTNKNWEKAYDYQNLSYKLKDSVYNEETRNKILKLEMKQVTELKDKEIRNLYQEKKYSNLRNYFLLASLILVIIIILIIFAYNRKTRKDNILLKEQNIIISEKEKLVNEINASKDKFFSIIAHDLRNPLGSFKVVTNLMYEKYNYFEENERLEYLKLLNDSSNNIYTLLENLLEWSGSQSGNINFNPKEIDLKIISENTIKLLKTSSDNKKISIDNKISDSLKIWADPYFITTVIRNLISNAIKYTAEAGNIEIGANLKTSEGYIEIYIKDSGVGMDSETINKLFRIDVHVSTLGTSSEIGTGLGLILCKEFVERHNGKIRVESEVGKGSTFYITLPLK